MSLRWSKEKTAAQRHKRHEAALRLKGQFHQHASQLNAAGCPSGMMLGALEPDLGDDSLGRSVKGERKTSLRLGASSFARLQKVHS